MTSWPTPPPAPSEGAPPPAAMPFPAAGSSFPAAGPSAASAEPPLVRRRQQRMVPRPADETEAPTVTRGVLNASRSTVKPQTRRDRKLVGTLPDWDPLPPGELLVTKPSITP